MTPSLNDVLCPAFGIAFVALLFLLAFGWRWRLKYGSKPPEISEAVLPPLSSQHPFIQPKENDQCDSQKPEPLRSSNWPS